MNAEEGDEVGIDVEDEGEETEDEEDEERRKNSEALILLRT